MQRQPKTQFDPGAAAADISGVLTALAGLTELGSTIDIPLESAEPLQSLAAEVSSRARSLAKETLEARAEVVGVEDPAIEKARQPIERMPLEHADHSTVVGSVRDVESAEGISGGRVVAKTPDGQTVGEAAVDTMGNFAIELTGNPKEVRIEAFDSEEKSVSVSTVELAEQPGAHFVEMVSATSRRDTAEEGETVEESDAQPIRAANAVSGSRDRKSEKLRRIRNSVRSEVLDAPD